MELKDMTIEELKALAKKEEMVYPPNSGEELLREKLEYHFLEKHVRLEEEARNKVRLENQVNADIAEIVETAKVAHIPIEVPDKPTVADVIRLRKYLGIKKAEPKPTPETVGIRESKKVYAIFRNMESPELDVPTNLGGETPIHLFDGKMHVLPMYAIRYWQKQCKQPRYKRVVAPDGKTSVSVEDVKNEPPRFVFEIIRDAPQDAKFGIVDPTTIETGVLAESAP